MKTIQQIIKDEHHIAALLEAKNRDLEHIWYDIKTTPKHETDFYSHSAQYHWYMQTVAPHWAADEFDDIAKQREVVFTLKQKRYHQLRDTLRTHNKARVTNAHRVAKILRTRFDTPCFVERDTIHSSQIAYYGKLHRHGQQAILAANRRQQQGFFKPSALKIIVPSPFQVHQEVGYFDRHSPLTAPWLRHLYKFPNN